MPTYREVSVFKYKSNETIFHKREKLTFSHSGGTSPRLHLLRFVSFEMNAFKSVSETDMASSAVKCFQTKWHTHKSIFLFCMRRFWVKLFLLVNSTPEENQTVCVWLKSAVMSLYPAVWTITSSSCKNVHKSLCLFTGLNLPIQKMSLENKTFVKINKEEGYRVDFFPLLSVSCLFHSVWFCSGFTKTVRPQLKLKQRESCLAPEPSLCLNSALKHYCSENNRFLYEKQRRVKESRWKVTKYSTELKRIL